MSEAARANWQDPEYRARYHAGRDAEYRSRARELGKQQMTDPAYVARWQAGLARAGRGTPAEASQKSKDLWHDPEYRARWKDGLMQAISRISTDDE